ncbi:MAG: BMP family ABC transporter substrate-binding protein, partial [Pseudomonadota bacterium]
AMDGTWSSGSHWTGLKTGLVGIADYNPAIPDNVVAAAEAMRTGIIEGSAHPFTGPILDVDGTERVAAGEILADDKVAVMDWYVKGVQA